jgi:hypothetical protein
VGTKSEGLRRAFKIASQIEANDIEFQPSGFYF